MNKLLLFIMPLAILFTLNGCKEKEETPADESDISNFDLVFVEDNQTDIVLKPKLVWEAATSNTPPVTYSLYMDKVQNLSSENDKPVTLVQSGLELNYYRFNSNLDLSTKYRWMVVATDKAGSTKESSSIFTFTTTIDVANNHPPDSFNLLLPIDGFIDAPLKPTLSWQAATDPDGHKVTYDVYFGKNPNPNGLIVFNSSATSFSIPNELEYETTYYWWVQAIDEKGAFVNSVTFSFKTIKDPNGGTYKFKQHSSSAFQNTTGRYGHQMVVWNNKAWLIGGRYIGTSGSGNKNDVWSFDGIDWTLVKAHDDDQLESFYASDESQVVVFDNKLWVFVGTRNNIYNSSDGVNWNNVTVSGSTIDTTHWKGKHGHQVIVFDNKMWVIGGTNGGIPTNDVWSSSNGEDWTKVKVGVNSGFSARVGHSAFVFNNKIWVIGGLDTTGSVVNDVWNSTDGITWNEVLAVGEAPFSSRSEHDCVVFEDNIYLVGGQSLDDMWYSDDGIIWYEYEDDNPDYRGRSEHQCLVFENALWTFFGKDQAQALNDIWYIE